VDLHVVGIVVIIMINLCSRGKANRWKPYENCPDDYCNIRDRYQLTY